MKSLDLKTLLLGGSLLAGTFAYSTMGYAQETPEVTADDVIELVDEAEPEEAKRDNIIVTGSRIKRDSFTSISPLQVITADISREAGLIDPADILQGSTASTGQQIDTTFQGFVLDNGPGSSTVNLRGLGASRTLFLVNGRRMAPAGVEGAPSTADLNLVPRILVDRFDVLLDGASSVYGSDAVAGVTNAILKKDFEGLTVEAFVDESEHGGGSRTISGMYGKNTDRGFIGFGAEYSENDEVKLSDRPWTTGCDEHFEVDENGNTRNLGIDLQFALNQRPDACKTSSLAGRISAPLFGSVYFIDGVSNSGIPNFNESGLFSVGVDSDHDGVTDVSWADYSLNNEARNVASLFPDFKRFSLMSFGEITLDQNGVDVKPYYEIMYSKRQTKAVSGTPQLFPDVVAENSFNPCGVNGVDCGTAYTNLLTSADYIQEFQAYYNGGAGSPNCFGLPASICLPATFGLLTGPIGPQGVTPIVSVKGDRDYVESEVGQLRLVGGVEFDMPYLEGIGLNGWSADVSITHSSSKGTSLRTGINEAKLNFALGQEFDATGNVTATPGACIAGPNTDLTAAEQAGCVPVNLFTPSLYSPLIGDFATQGERDYLFSDRTFDTRYKQTTWSAYATGNLMEAPGGTVAAVVGAEIRNDSIDSIPNRVASEGQLFGFFVDEGAVGDKTTKELYAEVAIPLVADKPFFKQLDVELAGRYTHDEFYGGAGTYSAKAGWRPFDSLLVRGSIGTSFRAPNLRELFLKNQSGFNSTFDPCSVPQDAVNPLTGGYDPQLDGRDQKTLDNCVLAGVDPTTFNAGSATGSYSIEINRFGAFFDPGAGLDSLEPETSISKTVGFSFEQPFTDAFELEFGTSYYDITVEDAIVELTPSFVVIDCYVIQANLSSPRCANVTRDSSGFIQNVKAGFENQGGFNVRGFDINARASKEFIVADRVFDVNLDVTFNNTVELSQLDFNPRTGLFEDEDFVGQPGVPEWKGLIRAFVDMNDFRFSWTTNFIQGTEVALEDQDVFSDAVLGGSQTCLGPTQGDVQCRDVDFLDDYWLHSASLYYRKDTWTLGAGVRNVFDKEPPKVDGSEIQATNNTPIGYGYNLNGRTFFINASKTF